MQAAITLRYSTHRSFRVSSSSGDFFFSLFGVPAKSPPIPSLIARSLSYHGIPSIFIFAICLPSSSNFSFFFFPNQITSNCQASCPFTIKASLSGRQTGRCPSCQSIYPVTLSIIKSTVTFIIKMASHHMSISHIFRLWFFCLALLHAPAASCVELASFRRICR